MLKLYSTLLATFCIVNADNGFLEFGNGKLGVNFFGHQASIGTGADGKLQAFAGTPWGQQAEAGLGGSTGNGDEGSLYAGATAGGGVSAAAGIGGSISGAGSYGGSYAGASAGGHKVEVIKEKVAHGGASGTYTKKVEVVKKPVEVGVIQEVHPIAVSPPESKPVTTVIHKTVIPNYEKKIVKVPSYEEKVVRVPTVVEKEVWVPAAPTVIEKEVPVFQPQPPVIQTFETVPVVPVVYKTKVRKHPFLFRKYINVNGGYGGGYAGGYAGAAATGVGASSGGTYSATVTKTTNPQFYNDVFNIPISTLGAVQNFLSGLSSGASAGGSIGITKTKTFSKSYH